MSRFLLTAALLVAFLAVWQGVASLHSVDDLTLASPVETFDALNMRINGYEFHKNLLAGEEAWDSKEVKEVFSTWAELLPLHEETP